jgi:hypothetical protein
MKDLDSEYGSMPNLKVMKQIRLDCYQVPNLINMISIT